MDREDIALALALLVGVALTGQVAGLVDSVAPSLSVFVWPIGYGSIVLAAWYIWIRPIDFRAPDPDESGPWASETGDTTDPEQ